MGECTLGFGGRATNETYRNINVAESGKVIPIGQGTTLRGKDIDGVILDGNYQWKLPDGRTIKGDAFPKDVFKFNNAQNATVTNKGNNIFEISISPLGKGEYLENGTPVVFKDWTCHPKK